MMSLRKERKISFKMWELLENEIDQKKKKQLLNAEVDENHNRRRFWLIKNVHLFGLRIMWDMYILLL